MVEVVWLIGREEGKMVATVSDRGVEHCHSVPQPGDREVRAHDEWTEPNREDIR